LYGITTANLSAPMKMGLRYCSHKEFDRHSSRWLSFMLRTYGILLMSSWLLP